MVAPVSVHPMAVGEPDMRRGGDIRRRVGWLRAPGSRSRHEGSESTHVQLAWESGAPLDDTVYWVEATDGPALLLPAWLKPLFEEHDLDASFRLATVHWASESSNGYALMELTAAADDLIDVSRSTFMMVNPYLGVVEGRVRPTSVVDLTERVTFLTSRPELAGWKITPTEVHLRRHTDLFRLPTHPWPALSASLVGALDEAGVGGLEVGPGTFSVTFGPDW